MFESMFAWILNTKPENFSSVATTSWLSALWHGAGAQSVRPSSVVVDTEVAGGRS